MKNLFKNKFYKIIILLLLIIFFIWIYSFLNNYIFRKNNFKEYFVPSIILEVLNLPFSFQDNDLEKLFAEYGFTVINARIIMNINTGKSKKFGFVEMANKDEANKAISKINGKTVDGSMLYVNITNDLLNKRSNEGGGGGLGGGDRRGIINSISCPLNTPYWDIKLQNCTPCPTITPIWNNNLQKCEPCPKETPYWDTTSNPPKCACPTTTPIWNKNLKKCEPCPKETPYWDTTSNPPKCIFCPSSQPYWNLNSTQPKCEICPQQAPIIDKSSTPFKCTQCPWIKPKWDTDSKKCIASKGI
jgi:hypothetical protein